MGSSSLEYFLKNQLQNKSSVIGYFDFSNTENSGYNILTGNYFNKNNYLLLEINDYENFWSNSGIGSLAGTGFYKISGNLSNNFFCAMAVKSIATGKDNVLYSSYGCDGQNCSGYRVIMAKNGFPYIEYKDLNFGTKYFSYSKNINLNDSFIIYFGIDTMNSLFIGTFSNASNSVLEESCPWSVDFAKSTTACIGGDASISSQKYFSGQLKEYIICENSSFLPIDKSVIASGIVYDITETINTGIISGQTGILYGDIIEIKSCSVQISGQTGIAYSGAYTGIEYYVPTYQEFIDFNNESFSNFYYSGVSGLSYKKSYIDSSNIVVCSQISTGYDFYEYDSGYQIEYKIKELSTILKYPNYFYSSKNKLRFNYDLNSGDIVSIFYQTSDSYFKNGSNFKLINFDNEKRVYYSKDYSNNLSGIYYNGQYQIYDSGYNIALSGYKNIIIPEQDFTTVDNYIYSKNYYIEPSYIEGIKNSFILSDLWANKSINYFSSTGLYSGQNITNLNFSGSMVFFNGQLLTSGTDYELPNKILFNSNSGNDVISIINLDFLNKYINIINSGNQNFIYLNDSFIEKSAMVWVNGVRCASDLDYIEM